MARSNEPMVWSLFSAGGMLSALTTPALILMTGILIPLGILGTDALQYEQAHAFAVHPLGKIILFVLIFLPLWHGMHRFRFALVDLGMHGAKTILGVFCYGFALFCTVIAIMAVVRI